jgi:hypothetical protein
MVISLSKVTSGRISLTSLGSKPRGFLLRHEGRAQCLERRVAEMMVAVEMAVDHPFDRLVRDLANALDEIQAIARMLAGVDHQDAVIGREDDRVRRGEFEQEVEVGRDLLERHRARGGRLRRRRRAREEQARQHHRDTNRALDRRGFHLARPPVAPAQCLD